MDVNEKLITITDKAVSKLREIMARENNKAAGVRLALVRTRCMGGRGFGYEVTPEEFPTADDVVSEENGIKVYIDPASAKYLVDAELDYVDTRAEAGFKVDNPNIVARCPCGRHDIFE